MLHPVNISLHRIVILALLLLLPSSLSFSLSSQQQPRRSTSSSSPVSKYPFLSFEFDPSTNICRNPASFQYSPNNQVDDESQYFVLRNVPGVGDCIFHAVLSAVFISMGFMNPDAAFVKDTLVSSMAVEMRSELF